MITRIEKKAQNGEKHVDIIVLPKVEYFSQAVHSIVLLKQDEHQEHGFCDSAEGTQMPLQLTSFCFFGPDNIFEFPLNHVDKFLIPFLTTYAAQLRDQKSSNFIKQGVDSMHLLVKTLQFQRNRFFQSNIGQLVELKIVDEIIEQSENAKKRGQILNVADFDDILNENFVRKLEICANQWMKIISQIVSTKYETKNGSIKDCIEFYEAFKSSVMCIVAQIETVEIETTINLLKNNSKDVPLITFIQHGGITNVLESAKNYLNAINEIDVERLLSATKLSCVNLTITQFFEQVIVWSEATSYTESTLIQITNSLCNDFVSQVLKIMALGKSIMEMDDNEFVKEKQNISSTFETWNQGRKKMLACLKQNENNATLVDINENVILKRLNSIIALRQEHASLKQIINVILTKTCFKADQSSEDLRVSSFETRALDIVNRAFGTFLQIDVLTMIESEDFDNTWDAIKRRYDENIAEIENQISTIIQTMSKTKTHYMIKVLQCFMPVFARSRLAPAIQLLQQRTIQQAEEDLFALKQKFLKKQSPHTNVLLDIRGFPRVSANIIQGNQIKNKLKNLVEIYKSASKDALGQERVEQFVKEALNFESKLDIFIKDNQQQFDSQIREIDVRQEQGKNVFDVIKRHGKYEIVLNFNENIFTVVKNAQHLKCGQVYITYKLKQLHSLYLYAISLQQSLRIFQYSVYKLADNFSMLMSKKKNAVDIILLEGLKIDWRNQLILSRFANQVEEKVKSFDEDTCFLIDKIQVIEICIDEMIESSRNKDILNKNLTIIQTALDDLYFKDFNNFKQWANIIEDRLCSIFIIKLEEEIKTWTQSFNTFKRQNTQNLTERLIEVKFSNNQVVLEPSISEVRAFLYNELYSQLELICQLHCIDVSRYELFKGANIIEQQIKTNYSKLLLDIDQNVIQSIYETVERHIVNAEKYATSQRRYQMIQEIEIQDVIILLMDNLEMCQQFLNEIKEYREYHITGNCYEKSFGTIIVHCGEIKQYVYNTYGQWYEQVVNKIKGSVTEGVSELTNRVDFAKKELIQFESEHDDVFIENFISILEIRHNQRQSRVKIQKLMRFNQLLEQKDQTQSTQQDLIAIQRELDLLQPLLEAKFENIQSNIPTVHEIIFQKEQTINENIRKIQYGQLNVMNTKNAVMDTLEASIKETKKQWIQICKAKYLLETGRQNSGKFENLEVNFCKLKPIWEEIFDIWVDTIKTVNETLFSDYIPQTTSNFIDVSFKKIECLQNNICDKTIFYQLNESFRNVKEANSVYSELKSGFMKPRHWNKLLERLGSKIYFKDMILLDLWQADVVKNVQEVKLMLELARNEIILEDSLAKIKDHWAICIFNLVSKENKCKLIKGWDEILGKIDEDINCLQSMKISPFYKAFDEEITSWDEKLTKMRIIFDSWMDMQKKYVYLEGIFFGSADIKDMLHLEFLKFELINSEISALMKKINQKPTIIEVLHIQGLKKQIEKCDNVLSELQKALGEYLENQRLKFARLYFVGDEDLLELIGGSKEIRAIQRHLPKMFAGIAQLSFEKEDDVLIGMCSREGECVPFTDNKKVMFPQELTIYVKLTEIEHQMRISLATHLDNAITKLELLNVNEQQEEFNQWMQQFAAQIIILSIQTSWTNQIEESLNSESIKLSFVEGLINNNIGMLAEKVLVGLKKDVRQKYEQIITILVHQKEVTRLLINQKIIDSQQFAWLYHMRFYWRSKERNLSEKLSVQVANSHFYYGFEYLGIGEQLVQTPLTDRCYFTLTQALHQRLGGSPFGPAGTGKTETVKALGSQLGRFVLVFNCDETFDGNAMGRIFAGLCQMGAWGCFDEFNRLDECMLSAVSQQIQDIQAGLREHLDKINIANRDITLNPAVGIFVTMNPGYAGRSNLPDNLKQLFRQIAIVKPDKEMIVRVILYTQGFKSAKNLSGKIVSLFDLCKNQLSTQSHYDFGLRALKLALISGGNLKRLEQEKLKDPSEITVQWEQYIMIMSLCDTLLAKFIAEDVPIFSNLLSGVFPGSSILQFREEKLIQHIEILGSKFNLVINGPFVEKVLQLYKILSSHNGVMMIGTTGCGKSVTWKILLQAMEMTDGVIGKSYIINPKAIHKDELYGKIDSTTGEWMDGVFTNILRRIIDNAKGEDTQRHWIIFDGDVDPEWAENLNSVLDDNKLFTLPSGERFRVPLNIKIMFEVGTLKYATLATVSRCGMIYFSDNNVTIDMLYEHYLARLEQQNYNLLCERSQQQYTKYGMQSMDAYMKCAIAIKPLFFQESGSFMTKSFDYATKCSHVMEFTRVGALESTFALIRKGISDIIQYNKSNQIPLNDTQIEQFIQKRVVFSALWGIGGSMNLQTRINFGNKLHHFTNVVLPSNMQHSLIDYEVRLEDQEWHLWNEKVPIVEIEPSEVGKVNLVITTLDTIRHQDILYSWIAEHKSFILCGPPGSGKTMTLMTTLESMPDVEMVVINFSSSTTPELILKTFDRYCQVFKKPNGLVLEPRNPSKRLVVFCDEINLPDTDKYGTQRVITFLKQITEHSGYWRTCDHQWVSLERIQFVGACNPPTDTSRQQLSDRFLRHYSLIFIDFPSTESLKQIYGAFNRAMLKNSLTFCQLAEPLTDAMVEFYVVFKQHFTLDMQPHYIYSPRELTRWKFAIFEGLSALVCQEDIVRLYIHEALRLFQDRLVHLHEKELCNNQLKRIVAQYFHNCDWKQLFDKPILYTKLITKEYKSVQYEELKIFIENCLQNFCDQELNVPLVVFNSVIDHILRIDRVLKQPLGHLLLIGASGAGKTTLSRFVAWMNGFIVFQIKAGRNYSMQNFDDDLRHVMKRAGCNGEKICFIFDESNALSPAFLERMNALLTSGEVPGLFCGNEYTLLINQLKEAPSIDKKCHDLFKNFTQNVQRNLHIIFTTNPSNPDFSNYAISSPALFNRCVINWFGDWSKEDMVQVAKQLTTHLQIFNQHSDKQIDEGNISRYNPHNQQAFCKSLVDMHLKVKEINDNLLQSAKKFNYITPRDFMDFIKHFIDLYQEKNYEINEQQRHLNTGLDMLKQTETTLEVLQKQLSIFQKELEFKDKGANEKLQMIIQEQNQAEQNKELVLKTQKELEFKTVEISKRQIEVQNKLDECEPALIEAQQSVLNIQKNYLDELRNLPNPPAIVKLALEPVIALISKKTVKIEWVEIRQWLRKENFISEVMNFDKNMISPKVKKFIQANYLDKKEEFDIEKIQKASKAAGPLAMWVRSLIKYAHLFEIIQPLKTQLVDLQISFDAMKSEMSKMQDVITHIECRIEQYKAEFSQLIGETQNIKNEIKTAQDKACRSIQLISDLSLERTRWEDSKNDYIHQTGCLLVDVLLSAAFLTYIGFFNHKYRQYLLHEWKLLIQFNGLNCRKELSLIEFLSQYTDRLQWQIQALPDDELCVENAIILKRFNRYPLVIDPSDQAFKYISNHYADKSIKTTSFAVDSYIKYIESAIKFGLPIIIQDAEKIDSVLNNVLNKEVQKVQGRLFIRVGDQDIDLSANFMLFMFTRDSTVTFAPHICSRVTFVNFTVTPSFLQNKCLLVYLKNEREDIYNKRSELLKLQGECKIKLKKLEDALLEALNKSEGDILDNNTLITTLQSLKKEAVAVADQAKQTEYTMKDIEMVTNQYLPLSKMTSRIFFTLDYLSQFSFLYQYSLQHFMDHIFAVLHQKDGELTKLPKTNPEGRLQTITNELFIYIFLKISQGLLLEHQPLFALKLIQIKLGQDFDSMFEVLLKSDFAIENSSNQRNQHHQIIEDVFGKDTLIISQIKQLEELCKNKLFSNLISSLQQNSSDWALLMVHPNAEKMVPEIINTDIGIGIESNIMQFMKKMAVLKILRPDRFIVMVNLFAQLVFGQQIMHSNIDLKTIVVQESQAKRPLLLVSAPGFDVSFKVDMLIKQEVKNYTSVAIGSPDACQIVDSIIQTAVSTGQWVLLKNVHLAPVWLGELWNKICNMQVHSNFRLFLTMNFNPKVPVMLFRAAHVFVFEPPSGIKASLQRSYASIITAQMIDNKPAQCIRLYFLVSWLNAVVQERLRYTPIGWSKKYEFSENDQRCAIECVNELLDQMLKTQTNLQSAKIPWDALRVLMQSVFGGKIDSEFDDKILTSLINQFFCQESFLVLPHGSSELILDIPNVKTHNQMLLWIKELPDIESPIWCGLPLNVQRITCSRQTHLFIKNMRLLQDTDNEFVATGKQSKQSENQYEAAWLTKLQGKLDTFSKILPLQLELFTRTDQIANPLFKFFEKEITTASLLLNIIHIDLQLLKEMCTGCRKPNNALKKLAEELYADVVPMKWRKYNIDNVSAIEWVEDFKRRVEQLHKIRYSSDFGKSGVFIGLFLFPEAYLIATKQSIAQIYGLGLEDLELKFEVDPKIEDDNPFGFIIEGLTLENASYSTDEKLFKCNGAVSNFLPKVNIKWVIKSKANENGGSESVQIPVYLNIQRTTLLFIVDIPAFGVPTFVWHQHGVALFVWNRFMHVVS